MTKKWEANPMRETRRKLKLTQQAMAHILGCSLQTIHRHEHRPGHYTVVHWRLALRQLLVEHNGS